MKIAQGTNLQKIPTSRKNSLFKKQPLEKNNLYKKKQHLQAPTDLPT